MKLVVVDSITFHFRQDFRDMAQRSRLLTRMAQDVMALAERHALAAVFMNQVTTKVLDGGSTSKLVPALGESWGHAASTRVILYWQGPDRHAHVYKSQSQPPATARYVITADGVRAAAPPAAMAATAAATTSAAAAGPPAGAQQDNKRRAPPPAEDGRDYYHEQGAVAAAGWQQQLGPGGRAVDQSYVATAANKRPAR